MGSLFFYFGNKSIQYTQKYVNKIGPGHIHIISIINSMKISTRENGSDTLKICTLKVINKTRSTLDFSNTSINIKFKQPMVSEETLMRNTHVSNTIRKRGKNQIQNIITIVPRWHGRASKIKLRPLSLK